MKTTTTTALTAILLLSAALAHAGAAPDSIAKGAQDLSARMARESQVRADAAAVDALEQRFKLKLKPAEEGTGLTYILYYGGYPIERTAEKSKVTLNVSPNGKGFQDAADIIAEKGGFLMSIKYGDGSLADYKELRQEFVRRGIVVDELIGRMETKSGIPNDPFKHGRFVSASNRSGDMLIGFHQSKDRKDVPSFEIQANYNGDCLFFGR